MFIKEYEIVISSFEETANIGFFENGKCQRTHAVRKWGNLQGLSPKVQDATIAPSAVLKKLQTLDFSKMGSVSEHTQ